MLSRPALSDRYVRIGERIGGAFEGTVGRIWRSSMGLLGAGGIGASTWRYHGVDGNASALRTASSVSAGDLTFSRSDRSADCVER